MLTWQRDKYLIENRQFASSKRWPGVPHLEKQYIAACILHTYNKYDQITERAYPPLTEMICPSSFKNKSTHVLYKNTIITNLLPLPLPPHPLLPHHQSPIPNIHTSTLQ